MTPPISSRTTKTTFSPLKVWHGGEVVFDVLATELRMVGIAGLLAISRGYSRIASDALAPSSEVSSLFCDGSLGARSKRIFCGKWPSSQLVRAAASRGHRRPPRHRAQHLQRRERRFRCPRRDRRGHRLLLDRASTPAPASRARSPRSTWRPSTGVAASATCLIDQAVRLFRERRVTLGYVWTRADNEAAVRLYRSAGFEHNRQLVLTWYPTDPSS